MRNSQFKEGGGMKVGERSQPRRLQHFHSDTGDQGTGDKSEGVVRCGHQGRKESDSGVFKAIVVYSGVNWNLQKHKPGNF